MLSKKVSHHNCEMNRLFSTEKKELILPLPFAISWQLQGARAKLQKKVFFSLCGHKIHQKNELDDGYRHLREIKNYFILFYPSN